MPYIEDDAQRVLYEKIQEAEFRSAAADSRLIQLRQFQAKEVAFQWKARAQISDYAQTVDWRVMEALAAADDAEQRLEAQAQAADQWRELAEHLESRLRALENENYQRSRLEAWEAKEGKRNKEKQKDVERAPSKWQLNADETEASHWVAEEPQSEKNVDGPDAKVEAEDAISPAQSSANSISREQFLKMQRFAPRSSADQKSASDDASLKTLSTAETSMSTGTSPQGKNRVKELQAQVESLHQEIKALKGQLKRQKDEAVIVEQLKNELTKLRVEKKTSDKEKAQLETRLARSEEENKIMKRRLKRFERELSTSVGSAGFSTEASVDSDEEAYRILAQGEDKEVKEDSKTVPTDGTQREGKSEGKIVSDEERGRSAWFFW
eukprot:gnl/MRDRNA2_/MRDRNA2_149388_c0_seq1.p1 gnl/MRDRNA2_/MRDRNA2_149388_c0~~gnl/MRDRNA2_/MRDRNA2_149388_c0_seq1.p1  ORF type:complete len:422 (-),score=133.96 gnl/MRDRNA2_/MRDRNA2_149388_c0_seq1:163-1305(-)